MSWSLSWSFCYGLILIGLPDGCPCCKVVGFMSVAESSRSGGLLLLSYASVVGWFAD